MKVQELRDMVVAEILETDAIELLEARELGSFSAYDSVARLTLMVGLSDFTGRPVTVPELLKLHTFGDVMKLVGIDTENGQHS